MKEVLFANQQLTNMVMLHNFEVMFDKFSVERILSSPPPKKNSNNKNIITNL